MCVHPWTHHLPTQRLHEAAGLRDDPAETAYTELGAQHQFQQHNDHESGPVNAERGTHDTNVPHLRYVLVDGTGPGLCGAGVRQSWDEDFRLWALGAKCEQVGPKLLDEGSSSAGDAWPTDTRGSELRGAPLRHEQTEEGATVATAQATEEENVGDEQWEWWERQSVVPGRG